MTRVVLDTNILISAFEFGGLPREAFLLASPGLLTAYTSEPLLAELGRVLQERFRYPRERVAEIGRRLRRLCVVVDAIREVNDCDDPDDNRVLECALAARAQFIVTGDKALLRLSPYRGIRIVSAAELQKLKPWVGEGQA